MSVVEIKVPDIGDFDEVEIIEVLVSVGDMVEANQDVITLESDKAAMEIPTSTAGTITAMSVTVGDKVKEGSVILTLETAEETKADAKPAAKEEAKPEVQLDTTAGVTTAAGDADLHAEVLVLGSGPGG